MNSLLNEGSYFETSQPENHLEAVDFHENVENQETTEDPINFWDHDHLIFKALKGEVELTQLLGAAQ